jgi:hypothetical protein
MNSRVVAMLAGLLLTPAFLVAQSDAAPNPSSVAQASTASVPTLAQGLTEGRSAADSRGMGGRMVGGFVVGFTTGLIGTGIMYFATGGSESDVPDYLVLEAASRGPEYMTGYRQGYAQKLKSKRRSAGLAGGLAGTATAVALVYSMLDSEQERYSFTPVFAVSLSTR